MDQALRGMQLLRPTPLAPDELKALIRGRGWRMADAALRWNIRIESLNQVVADPGRATRWDDLARALPQLTREERAAVSAVRLSWYPRRAGVSAAAGKIDGGGTDTVALLSSSLLSGPCQAPLLCNEIHALVEDGFRYQAYVGKGSELAVVMPVADLVQPDDALVVVDVRLGLSSEGEVQEEYLCQSVNGIERWLEPDQMDDWVVCTGRTLGRATT